MGRLKQEQTDMWALGLLERAERLSAMLNQKTIPAIDVAELTGYAKSAAVLLSEKELKRYHETQTLDPITLPTNKEAEQ